MKIKVINPNTSTEMTEGIRISAEKAAEANTEIVCVNPKSGPITIEGSYDEIIASYYLVEEVLRSEKEENYDAYVIACFGDPALYALREITDKPVIGIAEAAISMASFISGRFSIVSVMPKSRLIFEELVHRYGAERKLASLRTPDLSVLDTSDDIKKTQRILIEEAKIAVEEDYAEAILLGCAGMVGFTEEVEKVAKVPVIDSVAAGVKVAEALVTMNLRTSKIYSFEKPGNKKIVGVPEIFRF